MALAEGDPPPPPPSSLVFSLPLMPAPEEEPGLLPVAPSAAAARARAPPATDARRATAVDFAMETGCSEENERAGGLKRGGRRGGRREEGGREEGGREEGGRKESGGRGRGRGRERAQL